MDVFHSLAPEDIGHIAEHKLQCDGHRIALQIQQRTKITVVTSHESEDKLRRKSRNRKRENDLKKDADLAHPVDFCRFNQRIRDTFVIHFQKKHGPHAPEHTGNDEGQRRADPAERIVIHVSDDAESADRHERNDKGNAEKFFSARKLQLAERIRGESGNDQPHDEGHESYPQRVEETKQQRRDARRDHMGIHAENLTVRPQSELPRPPDKFRRACKFIGRRD